MRASFLSMVTFLFCSCCPAVLAAEREARARPRIEVPTPASKTSARPSDPSYPYVIPSLPSPVGEPEVENPKPEEPDTWVTDVLLNASCEFSLEDFSVAQGHVEKHPCELVSATGGMEHEGDFFDVGGEFVWSAENKDFGIACDPYGHNRFCWPVGKTDLFDSKDGKEPSTTVNVCAENICPSSSNTSCHELVCTWFEAKSIVNLEGSWTLEWDWDNGNVPSYTLSQQGRVFSSLDGSIKRGVVQNDTVSFERDDTRFEGTISPDRQTMSGTATELLTLGSVGTWKATRK